MESRLLLALVTSITMIACASGKESSPDSACLRAASSALRTCAKGETVDGIDVSSYQGDVDWSAVHAAGRTFSFMRVSAGTKVDTKFAQNWPGARAAGVMRGVYQYFHPNVDATAQADVLVAQTKAAGGLVLGDLPPVLDLETTDSMPAATVVAAAKTWLARVEARTGVKPIVYTSAAMSATIGTSFQSYVLWVANYGVTCPSMPSGWTDWHFWQTGESGQVAGVDGAVDTDLFNGPLADLRALTVQPQAKPPIGAFGDEVDPTLFQANGDPAPDGSDTLGSTNPGQSPESATVSPCP